MRDSTEAYQLSYELLKQFLYLLENVLSCKPYIEDLNDSKRKKEFLENLMQSLMAILWTVKEKYQVSSNFTSISEIDEEYQKIVAKAADVMKKGQKKVEDWNLWELQLIKLYELIENSSCWLKEKNQIFIKEASNNKNHQHSYNTLKDLQWSISSFRHDIDLIKTLMAAISSHIEIPALEKSSTEVIGRFKELQNNVDLELNRVLFSKEWKNMKSGVEDLQHCLSSTNKQITRMEKKIKHMGCDDSVLIFLQDISKIEADIMSQENVCFWIRDNESLQEFSSEEFKKLKGAVSQCNQIIESCLHLKKTSLQKIAHSEKGKIEEKMKLWVKDVEDSFNNISSNCTMNPEEMINIKHKLIRFIKVLDIVTDYLSADKQEIPTEGLADDDQTFNKNKVELLEMKLKVELEKYETLILQYLEYTKLASEINFAIERIKVFLGGIKGRIWQMDHFEVAKSKRELEEFQKLLDDKVCQDFKYLDMKIKATAGTENLPNPLVEISVVESSISPIINEMEKYLQLWEHYQTAEMSLRSFLSQKKHILSICCLKIVSIEHLNDSIKTLQTLLDDIKANGELMEHYKGTGSEFETCLIGDSKSYIQNRIQSFSKEWVDLQQTTVNLFEDQSSLLKEWSEFGPSFQTLSSWLSRTQYEVMHSHPSRSHSYKELENILEGLNTNRNQLVSLQEIDCKIQSSSLLHSSVKESIKNKVHLLDSSVKSLEEASMYGNQELLNSIQEEKDDINVLQSAELFVGTIQNDFKMDIQLSKQELETTLSTTEMSLSNAASHYSAVECIRRRLLFDDTINFETAMNVTRTLISLQQATSRLTAYYINLRKTNSDRNSFMENIISILRFLKSFRQIFSAMPSDYFELLKFFMNFQLMDIYIHSYRPILHSVVQEGLKRCKAMDPSNSGLLAECFKGIQKEWDCLESIYESKLSELKKAISLWETYLHCIRDVKMWIRKAKKELKQHPRVLKPAEIQEKISLVQELINEEEMFSSMTEKAKEVAEELGVTVNSVARNNLLEEVSSLEETSQQQADLLKKVLKELKEAHFSFKEFQCELVTTEERVTAMCSFIHEMVSTPEVLLKNKLQETQVELQKIKAIILKLNELESRLKELGKNIFCCDYYAQITTLKDIVEALSTLFEQLAAKYVLLSEASDENQKFLEMYKILLKWNEFTENKLSRNYHESPESIEENLQLYIKNEALENSNLLQQITVLGQSLQESKEKSEFISSAISSCSTSVSRTLSLIDSRDQSLQNILTQKKRAILLQEQTEEFLTEEENYLSTPIQFTDVSLKDVDGFIQALETHQNEIQLKNRSIEALSKDTEELVSQPYAFSGTADRCLFQHSTQKISSKWALVKALASERYIYLTNVMTSWKDILSLLNVLEEWLDSKEKIASEIDFIEKDHPRCVYLEGIKRFESLKHSFQDDISLLHNVNAAYHKTAKQDLDVDGFLKNRVLVLNDRWRILYQKVCDILTALNNILQLWADYDQLHEHLHLFLTETHIKITELEHSNTFNQSEFNSIMSNFAHHEDTLERYKALANNLRQRSQCSSAEINHQVEEIEKYWAEVYGCLQNYGNSISKNTEAEKIEDSLQQAASSTFTAELPNAQDLETAIESEYKAYQTIDDDGITSSADNFETDSIIATSNKDSDEVTSSSYQKDVTEGKKLTAGRKSSEPGDDEMEFIKDLLAALEEAEDRIDSLETVLSEPTPSGINDSPAPNHSRLLAACRSSIDVIQHLNHLVSERSSDKSSKLSETDIQNRTEGMLIRWEKIEAATLSKEFRALENAKKWKQFSEELQDIEKWLLDTLDSQTSQSIADADFEKFIVFLQRHEELISKISEQKKAIIALNVTGQRFISSSGAKENLAAVDEKLKAVNDHWEKLCSIALEWQNRLQTEFLQSSEFCSTISEMELWLEDSKEKIQSVDLSDECSTPSLHKQHTEIYALKQQLENCSQRIKTLLNISGHLFQDKEEFSVSNEGIIEMQSRLHSIMTLSQCLLLECTDILTSLSALLTSRMALQERPCSLTSTYSNEDENPNRISRCCGFLLRVARASLPIQAILLLLLGAAILLPKEDEELSCRFSNNFASSLNPMLHYPDGPPPV